MGDNALRLEGNLVHGLSSVSAGFRDVVPLQGGTFCDNGLAALRHFGQIHVNIVQKASIFFSTILVFMSKSFMKTHQNIK
jgi:hypothetical protein